VKKPTQQLILLLIRFSKRKTKYCVGCKLENLIAFIRSDIVGNLEVNNDRKMGELFR